MKIHLKRFRVPKGTKVDLHEHPTTINPYYESKLDCEKLLAEHMERLSAPQQLHYASSKHALLLIFQAMEAAGKDGELRHMMSGVTRRAARSSASSTRAPPSWSTASSGGRRASCRNGGGSASLIVPITRKSSSIS